MKKKIALVCVLSLFLNSTAKAADLSDWAVKDYESMSIGGMLNFNLMMGNLKGNITRYEVATILVRLYEEMSLKKLEAGDVPFEDADDEVIKKAYTAKIISGKSEKRFDPDGFVTRQEFAKMIVNTLNALDIEFDFQDDVIDESLENFDDKGQIADWARVSMGINVKMGIINGVSDTLVSPLTGATREQAICMINRVYEKFSECKNTYIIPKLATNVDEMKNMVFMWEKVDDAKKYMFIIKDKNSEVCEALEIVDSNVTILKDDYETGTYTLVVGMENQEGVQTFSKPQDFSFERPIITYTPSANLTISEKEQRVFPGGKYFESEAEAKGYMVEITVPVWKMRSNGEKYTSTMSLYINRALADDVLNIFAEIYNSPEKFPIKDVGGYYWRNTSGGRLSHHSYGLCIDINANENYYVEPDGTPIVGKYWKPYEDPYSMPEDGIVVKTFAKYGFLWGGNCWSDKYAKDYMHFTYLGK